MVPPSFIRLWLSFLYLVLLQGFWRFIFLLFQSSELSSDKWPFYFKSFWVGAHLDAVIASYFLLPVLLTIFWLHYFISAWRYAQALRIYLALATAIISMLSLIDVYFFLEFNTHLNILTRQANVLRIESIQFLWFEYPVLKILGGVSLLTWMGHLLMQFVDGRISKQTGRWPGQIVFSLVSLVMLVSTLRGGWQERPIDWGYAIFSDDNLSNQIALNGIFVLGRSVIELSSEKNLRKSLTYVSTETALEDTREMIRGDNEIFIDDTSLKRKFVNAELITPNIVLFILESHVGEFCGYINPAEQGVTPVLDSLARKGISFTQCIANGQRSAFGIGSILMSWPTLPGLPLISQIEATQHAPCLANTLEQVGYRNIFLYGGLSQFDNMKGFALANGFDEVIDRDVLPEQPGTMWGMYDHYVFDYAKKLLDETEKPLQLTLFTTTNHQPWDFPESYKASVGEFSKDKFRSGAVHKTMKYVDTVLGEFMDDARSAPWFDNTIFVFVADHGLTVHRENFEDLRNGRIPLVFYAPQILGEPRLITQPVSQVDILPTLLSIIGYPEAFEAMGRNVLAHDNGYASRITNDFMVWYDGDNLLTEILGQSSTANKINDFSTMELSPLSNESAEMIKLRDRYHSYLQTAFTQFKGFGK